MEWIDEAGDFDAEAIWRGCREKPLGIPVTIPEEVMTPAELERVASDVRTMGPQRVMVNSNGASVSAGRAKTIYKVESDVVFIRGDGWTLGAPARLREEAHSTWPDLWVGCMTRDGSTWSSVRPVAECMS